MGLLIAGVAAMRPKQLGSSANGFAEEGRRFGSPLTSRSQPHHAAADREPNRRRGPLVKSSVHPARGYLVDSAGDHVRLTY